MTASAPTTQQAPADDAAPIAGACFAVFMDVVDLDASIGFYGRTMGFEVARIDRQGSIFATRSLTSRRFPGAVLTLREAFGKRVHGTSPGSITRIALGTRDFEATLRSLSDAGAHWVGTAPSIDSPSDRACFVDRDGYQIEVFRIA